MQVPLYIASLCFVFVLKRYQCGWNQNPNSYQLADSKTHLFKGKYEACYL